MSSYNLSNAKLSSDDAPPAKKLAQSKYAVSLSHSWTGLSLITLDNHSNIYFISLYKSSDLGKEH